MYLFIIQKNLDFNCDYMIYQDKNKRYVRVDWKQKSKLTPQKIIVRWKLILPLHYDNTQSNV